MTSEQLTTLDQLREQPDEVLVYCLTQIAETVPYAQDKAREKGEHFPLTHDSVFELLEESIINHLDVLAIDTDLLKGYEEEYSSFAEFEEITVRLDEYETVESRYWLTIADALYRDKARQATDLFFSVLLDFKAYLEDLNAKFWGKKTEQVQLNHFEVSLDCPHGWASHNDETESGKLYLYRWLSGQLDGLNSVAVHISSNLWVSYTHDPQDYRGLTEGQNYV